MPASLKIAPLKAATVHIPSLPSSSQGAKAPSSPPKSTPSNEVKKRGRKPMTAVQKAESKKQRDKLKGITKGKRGRPRKINNRATDYAAEMNEIRSKISNRFDSNKKKPVKKEEAGYFGPYIRSFQTSNEKADEDNGNVRSFSSLYCTHYLRLTQTFLHIVNNPTRAQYECHYFYSKVIFDMQKHCCIIRYLNISPHKLLNLNEEFIGSMDKHDQHFLFKVYFCT